MAKMNGCNEGMVAPSGSYSKRMNPNDFARNNLSKGGVNLDLGGGAKDNYEKSGAKETGDPLMKGGKS